MVSSPFMSLSNPIYNNSQHSYQSNVTEEPAVTPIVRNIRGQILSENNRKAPQLNISSFQKDSQKREFSPPSTVDSYPLVSISIIYTLYRPINLLVKWKANWKHCQTL